MAMQKINRSAAPSSELNLRDLVGKKNIFQPKGIAGLSSMADGLHYTTLEASKKVIQYRYANGAKVKVLFDAARCGNKNVKKIDGYALSKDESLMLVWNETKKIYRHSFSAAWWLWDLKTRKLVRLSNRPAQRLMTLSPDGSRAAFVSENNLFLVDLAGGRVGKETQITRDGKSNEIINGAGDWVYEEEFGVVRAFDFSPDGRYLAYLRFDESKVKQYTIPMYKAGEYPDSFTYKYPRAGEDNSVVSVHIHDIRTGRNRTVDVGPDKQQYIPRMDWTKLQGKLCVARLNRLQNKAQFLLCDATTGATKVLLTEVNKRYIELDHPTFLEDGKHFLYLSESGGYRHVYLYSMTGRLVRQVTKGRYDVTSFIGCDDATGTIYFQAALPTPMHRTVYAAALNGSAARKLSTREGLNSAAFGKGFKYYIHTHSSADTPPLITLHQADGRQIRTLQNNAALVRKVAASRISPREFFDFTTRQGTRLSGWMIKPQGFDPRKKYPVLMTVYGGPNSQTVMAGWPGVGWDQYLASRGYIVASVDGRGTGGRGESFRKCTYRQLGRLEVIDQVEAARYLGTLKYVDASRIGIFGWSYGGFMACGCILRGSDVFKSAVAVASVTNFRYYDTVYTERFMRTPKENPRGYDAWAPLSHAPKLKGKLLLVHGTADDNVHFQNSTDLATKLIEADKPFEMHFVPNKDHGIAGHPTRLNLYERMTRFVLENL